MPHSTSVRTLQICTSGHANSVKHWLQSETGHPVCPPTGVFLVLKLKFYTKIFVL